MGPLPVGDSEVMPSRRPRQTPIVEARGRAPNVKSLRSQLRGCTRLHPRNAWKLAVTDIRPDNHARRCATASREANRAVAPGRPTVSDYIEVFFNRGGLHAS